MFYSFHSRVRTSDIELFRSEWLPLLMNVLFFILASDKGHSYSHMRVDAALLVTGTTVLTGAIPKVS